MGIPGFFKWLTHIDNYPDIKTYCIEYESYYDEYGVYWPIDETKANPNGIEFDNLYIDMNEIIHSSAHSDYCSKLKTEDEIIKSIFDCIDRIFSIVRPRKLLYIAIDGVAPRAKLNHQRSKRFLQSKYTLDEIEQIEKIKSEILVNGDLLSEDQKEKIERFDENCITPGTYFMSHLANCLRYYIYKQMNTKLAWRSIKVILSDANVPGEGEHKIIDYIRRQRAQPNHDPYTQHVIYGNDADLIILGLATHEHYLTIIRGIFNPNKSYLCKICKQLGHDFKECKGITKEKLKKSDELLLTTNNNNKTQYIFVQLSILREYLYQDLKIRDQLSFEWNLERAIDDWVFICLLVGNDFLPNISSFEIHENVITLLRRIYLNNVPKIKDYLTDNGKLNMKFLEIILTNIGEMEDQIFKNRHKVSQPDQNNYQSLNKQAKPSLDINEIKSLCEKPLPIRFGPPTWKSQRPDSTINKSIETKIQPQEIQVVDSSMTITSNNKQKDRRDDETERETFNTSISNRQEEDNDSNDSIRLWEEGWRERYYKTKFQVDQDYVNKFRMQVAEHYAQGLCWILRYYYQGVPSWDWYYPYHYAPFASDFLNIKGISVHFNENSKPFKPLEQLMAMFPPQCAKYLPDKWQSLILEKNSPIIDFYPLSFSIDPNGKYFKSHHVVLLPFIDEKRLHKALESVYSLLTSEEKKRNEHENDRLFIHSENSCYSYLKKELDSNNRNKITQEKSFSMPIIIGIPGHIWRDGDDDKIILIGKTIKTPISNYDNISNNQVMCVKYRN